MGYRSDVGLVIKRESHNRAGDRLLINEDDEIFQDGMPDIFPDVDQILFVWESVKWFNTPIDDFLNYIDPEDFLFIRLGEEDGDTEIIGGLHHNDFDFGYVRNLVYSAPQLEDVP